jgi:tetratricopeptide (TPR) repeat protein
VDGAVADGPLADAAAVCKIAVELKRPTAVAGLFDRGLQRAKTDEAADPRGALDLLDAVAPLAPDAKAVTPTRQRLLEKVVVREPDNPEPAWRLAVIYEGQERLPECEGLLMPHIDRLGTSEGARILGHILARKDKFEQAHKLLQPYVEEHLQRLHHAEEALNNAQKRFFQEIDQEIDQGIALNFPYDKLKASGEAERQAIYRDYVIPRLKEDPSVKAAREELMREAPVVPVALDLGIVLLRRAQNMADPKAREAELQKAEKTFLAVQGQAGETKAYRLFLGQVYYWMGKPKEGRKQFDDLLAAEKREPATLVQVGMTLREVGGHSEGRGLVEEAYAKEQDKKMKYAIAGQRALLFTDLDDEITWLGRANPADTHVQASLAAARGQKAYQDGNDAEAARHLREAIGLYDRMTEDAGSLNNSGLAYFSLYRVTGEREALDKAIARMERAVAMRPRDSILLANASDRVLDGALRDVVGPAIDFKALKAEAASALLPFLYEDRAGRDRVAERVRQHPGVVKARALLERLLVLAPKHESSWALLPWLYEFTHDKAALVALARRIEGAELDQADSIRRALEGYQGKDRAKRLKELNAARQRQEALVKSLRKEQRGEGVTFAVAACRLAETLRELGEEGDGGDPGRVVALAEEAHKAAPSAATHKALRDALLYRASATLEKQEPAYKQMATRARRSVGTSYLVAAALAREGKPREAALKNPDVKRAIQLVREDLARFPDDAGARTWAMLRAAHPDEAAKVATALARDEAHQAKLAVGRKLSPVSATAALQAYWAAQAAGKEAEGRAALKAVAARGVPLPFDP